MTSDTIWQLIRYALLLAFGPLVTKGYLSSDEVTTVTGAIGVIFTTAWGVWVRFGTRTTTASHAGRIDTPVVSPATGNISAN
jgi:hypothetical protein